MTVREAEPADLSRLRTIQRRALAEPWPEHLEAAVAGPLEAFVVCESEPVGYATVVTTDGVAYLPELAVAPASQGAGHGSRLLAVLRDRLADRGLSELRVTVRADDDRARAFYADRGFEVVQRIEDHFETGDGLVCSLSLGR